MGDQYVWGGGMGTGVLMVEDDFIVYGGSFRWYGLILVGGYADFNNTTTEIHGAVITGLDELIGGSGGRSDVGGGGSPRHFRLYYDPCEINNALGQFTGFSPVPNSIGVNWATY